MKVVILFICVYILKTSPILCEPECKNFKTCGGCIGYAYDACVWCSAADHKDRRCQSKTYDNENEGWCKEPVYDPQLNVSVIQDNDFSKGTDANIVQFKPQRLKIKARPGVPIPINMSYKPAKDYPLDIYYLMDYSRTMRAHASELRNQGLKIYEELTTLTNNVHLGIGSFVDKPAMPFVDVTEQVSYSFKNHLSLTNNTELFVEALKDSPNGASYDKPEAGFDALMQVMACEDINWRSAARRIIVLCTDATYHSAGDGKFVGAIRPNDMECHLENGMYTMALDFDYPSVSQINKKATETNTKIIFAIAQAEGHYKALEKKIQGSKYIPLNKDSDIVNMIKTEYLELVRSVSIDSNLPSFMELKLHPDCSQNDNCDVKHEIPVNITGTLKIKTCPANKESNKKYLVKVGPVSLNEKLEIEVEIDCQCDCETNGQINSEKCSHAGTYQCGVCNCNNERYGSTCSCLGSSSETTDLDQCKANTTDLNFCSGRGICRCGKCECQSGFPGDYCEFDDNACPRPGNLLCAGNGKCKFGRCECDRHWIGDDCQCPDSDQSCIAPISKEVCSGKGKCKCGVCICEQKEGTNKICSGRFCDDCEELDLKRCKELEDYAYCNYNFNKTECDLKYNQTSTGVTILNITEINASEYQHRAKWCRKVLDDDSSLTFLYYYPPGSANTLEIIVQKELELPIIADIWVPVGSTIAAVLIGGLLTLLIWKYLADLHDKREYKKFEKSLHAGSDERNPLYQSPAMNFANPAYRG